MAKLRMEIEMEYDADIMHGEDEEARQWFFEGILRGENLLLADSGDLSDVIGPVRTISIIQPPNQGVEGE